MTKPTIIFDEARYLDAFKMTQEERDLRQTLNERPDTAGQDQSKANEPSKKGAQ